jgi:glycerophosphoryl diester phosphodiesterase
MSPQSLLLGHRGARAYAHIPENSFASFDLALEHGCDGFEFDVRLAGCGRALICHDAQVKSITVADAIEGQLADLPVLEDVMGRYSRHAFLDVEIKVPGLESKVLEALRQHPPARGYVVSSFLPEVITELRVRSETVKLGFICDLPDHLKQWRRLPVDFVIPDESLITQHLVRELHDSGKGVFAWTVNDANAMRLLQEWGVDGIISDDTQLLVRTCRGS